MDKKLKISIIALIVLVCFYFYDNSKQRSYQGNYDKVFNFDHSKISKVIILKNNDGIELEKIDSLWNINGHDSLIIKQKSIDTFFNQSLKVQINSLPTSNNPKDLSIYSLNDTLGVNLILLDKDGNTLSNGVFGISPSNYNSNYYRDYNNQIIYKTNTNILNYLTTNPKYWGENPPQDIPDSTASEATNL